MNPLDSIIQMFLMADTESVIKQVADRQLKGCNLPNEVETAIGIILLAVDDAKTSDHPSSANALYVQSFNRAKYFLV